MSAATRTVSAIEPIRRQERRPAGLSLNGVAFLDLLRMIAANAVLLGHAGSIFGLWSGARLGAFGVNIFFVLSGFLIMQSSLARVERPAPYFMPYLIDRFARIFTGYLPALIMVAAINAALPLGSWGQEGDRTGVLAFAGNMLLLQDYPLFQAFHRWIGPGLYIRPYNSAEPFWTIPIEFWIYVIFGLGFFGLAMRERLPGFMCSALTAIALPVVIWNAAAGGGNGLSLVWAVGASGGVIWVRGGWGGSRHLLYGCVIAALATVCLAGRLMKTGGNFQDIGASVIEALILLATLSVVESLPAMPRAWCGFCTLSASYSYSLYLVHNTVLITARRTWPAWLGHGIVPLAILACHVGAFCMYLAFERHYRRVGAWIKGQLHVQSGQVTA